MSWEKLDALPEVYGTSSLCLFAFLEIQKSESPLIRGATSTIGQEALNLAVNAGPIVTATTRTMERFEWLKSMRADDLEVKDKYLPDRLESKGTSKFDKFLDLIGDSVLFQSISLTHIGGRMLQAASESCRV